MLLAAALGLLVAPSASAERWILQAYALGAHAGNDPSGSVTMARPYRVPDGYRMLYNSRSDDGLRAGIRLAESTDGRVWTVGDTVLEGGDNPSDRTYVFGGPRLVPLGDGRLRLYLRAAQQPPPGPGSLPGYHILSAVSEDGLHFEMEEGCASRSFPTTRPRPSSSPGTGRSTASTTGPSRG